MIGMILVSRCAIGTTGVWPGYVVAREAFGRRLAPSLARLEVNG